MEVETQAGSGQEQETPASGNTGATSTSSSTPLSDAISAAIKATAESREEKTTPSADKVAGDERDGEDASASPDKQPVKTEPKDKDETAPKADAPKFEAPKHWPEGDRKAFAELPPEGQALIKRLSKDLEGGFTRRSQELGDKARYADQLRGLIDEPTRQQMTASGVGEVQYFQYLDGLQKFASRNPEGYVRWAMQNLGVTPDKLGFHTAAPKQPDEMSIDDLLVDPQVKQLQSELATLKGQASPEAMRGQAEAVLREMAAQQQRYSLQGVAQQFRAAQDDGGQLLYPHFDTVRRQMGALMDTDPELAQMPDGSEKMKTAYEMAVYARPDLRQSLIEAETGKRLAAEERKREAQRAKSVTSVKPSVGVATKSATPMTLDQIVREEVSARHR